MALVLGTLIGGVAAYNGTPYTIDRANGFVDLAAATNNLTETVADLNQTLAILEPFHGNPNPVFATSHTDYDLVKKQISTTIQAALAVLPLGPSSFAYQQALKNIQSDLTTTVERVVTISGGRIRGGRIGPMIGGRRIGDPFGGGVFRVSFAVTPFQ